MDVSPRPLSIAPLLPIEQAIPLFFTLVFIVWAIYTIIAFTIGFDMETISSFP